MAYQFPPIKRMVYPKTFLKDVHVIFRFDPIKPSEDLNQEIQKFFFETFSLQNITIGHIEKILGVFSKDELLRYDFSLSHVELSVKQPLYKSYENIQSLRLPLFKYMQVLGVKELSKIIMYKYNQLEFQSDGGGLIRDAMDGVFSKELLSDMTESDWTGLKGVTRWEKTKSIFDDDSNSLFTIEYGFRHKSLVQNRNALTLKTQIESRELALAVEIVEDKMIEYNQILDNGFHWCVVSDIIDAMKKE